MRAELFIGSSKNQTSFANDGKRIEFVKATRLSKAEQEVRLRMRQCEQMKMRESPESRTIFNMARKGGRPKMKTRESCVKILIHDVWNCKGNS